MNHPLSDPIGRDYYSTNDVPLERPAAVLVVAGDPGAAEFMRFALSERCALIEVVSTIDKAERLLSRCRFDVLVIDCGLPGMTAWMASLRAKGHSIPLVLMAERGEPPASGSGEAIFKPFSCEQMLAAVERALDPEATLEQAFGAAPGDDGLLAYGIVGHSEAMQNVLTTIRLVAKRDATVLLQGETGSGKEVAAQCLHRLSGRRGAFVPVNCGSIAPELIESELFGHARGAFTGATQARQGLFSYADGGTLFLDEIGEMPLPMQAKLLRAIEERAIRPVGLEQEQPVDVRIVAASNCDMAEEVAQGRFREDLYYRLNVIVLRLPSLRERPVDIPHLVRLFSQELAHRLDVPPLELDEREIRRLQAFPWPGNIRELRNVVERAMLLRISPVDCLDGALCDAPLPAAAPGSAAGYPEELTLADVERLHSLKVLSAAGGNKSEAARRLGVSRKTLERKLKAWQA